VDDKPLSGSYAEDRQTKQAQADHEQGRFVLKTARSDPWSYLWLAIGTLLSLFHSGMWGITLASWLSSVFLLRFMRTKRVLRAFILVWLAIYVTAAITWRDILGFGLPPPIYLVIMAINTLLGGGLPYLADRLLAPRLRGFAATLIFPLAVTAMVSAPGASPAW